MSGLRQRRLAAERVAEVRTPVSACRAREAACLALLGLAAGESGATASDAAAVLDHVAAGEWRMPCDLTTHTADALAEADLVRAGADGRLRATTAGTDALHCLLMAPVAAPVDPVTRVLLGLRLCLLDRLPPAERASQADALVAACEAQVAARRREAERFAADLPLLGLWSRQRRRLEEERDLCARVRDLFAVETAGPRAVASC